MANKVENLLSLLGGAGVGALAMYLFDPEIGKRRREEVVHTAEKAVGTTGEALHATMHGATDTARSVAEKISHYAKHLVDHVHSDGGGAVSHLSEKASHLASSAAGAVREHYKGASRTANSYLSEAKERTQKMHEAAMGEPHSGHSASGLTAEAIGLLVAGAGAMYFMDPNRGRARRAWLGQKAVRATSQTGKRARGLGRHVGNKLQGYAHEAEQVIPGNWRNTQGRADSGSQSSMPSARPNM